MSISVPRGKRIVKTQTRQLFTAFAASALVSAMILPGCSGSAGSTKPSSGAGAGGGSNGGTNASGGGGTAGALGRPAGAGGVSVGGPYADAGEGGLSECAGNAPLCRGLDVQQCCGQDPYGPATCQNGKWMCSLFNSAAVEAPGCNGQFCGQPLGEGGAGGEAGNAGALQRSR
jgi:hypothetical protein